MAQTENKGPNALPQQPSVPPGSPSATTSRASAGGAVTPETAEHYRELNAFLLHHLP